MPAGLQAPQAEHSGPTGLATMFSVSNEAAMNSSFNRKNLAYRSGYKTGCEAGALTAVAALALLALVPAPRVHSQSLADRLKGVQSGHEGPAGPTLPTWKPVSATTSSMTIPLVKGLIVSGAQAGDEGDREQIRTIKDTNQKDVTLIVEWDTPSSNPNQPPTRKTTTRIVDLADLATSHRFMTYFVIGQTEHYPGANGFAASTEILTQLRAGQASEFDFEANPSPLASIMADQSHLVGWNGHPMNKCSLHRVGTTDVSVPMLVNSAKVELPVLHAMCSLGGTDEAHFYFLDQPSNPIVIAGQVSGEISQMVKIEFPENVPAAGSSMEQALAEKKPVQIYGIYFDFNSSTIKPDSEAVLKQISDILHKNPDWKLSVAGHTDNIGDASANQQLSERRAVAVKDALVSRYGIASDRLTTGGFGASRPIEPNTTLEGRARNRRVELQRE
jgi:outer membrane protein OmpA-like peptidoglycan-associated protein